jgi:hypothetical protein
MRKYCTIIGLVLLVGIPASAETWSNAYDTVCYWYEQNVGPCPEDASALFELYDNSDGKGIHLDWKVKGVAAPAKASLKTMASTAGTWAKQRRDEKDANFEAWSKPELRALVAVLLDEINLLRARLDMTARSPAQLKTAIRQKITAQRTE